MHMLWNRVANIMSTLQVLRLANRNVPNRDCNSISINRTAALIAHGMVMCYQFQRKMQNFTHTATCQQPYKIKLLLALYF